MLKMANQIVDGKVLKFLMTTSMVRKRSLVRVCLETFNPGAESM